MASRGRVVEGTDGSDHRHRQTIEKRYSVIARAHKWIRFVVAAQLVMSATRAVTFAQGMYDGLEASPLLTLHVPAALALLLLVLDRSGQVARNRAWALWAFVAISAVQGAVLLFSGVLSPRPDDQSESGAKTRRAWVTSAAVSTAWAAVAAAGCAVANRLMRANNESRSKAKKRS